MPSNRLSALVWRRVCLGCFFLACISVGAAQDRPYFVAYSHDLEDVGEIDIESKTTIAGTTSPFGAMATEAEIGIRSWWTAGFYFDGQVTDEDSAISTGYRIENRFRPVHGEHAINPVLYFEYESISLADKTILEVVGHDGQPDMASSNGKSRRTHQHEGELRLILSSNVKSWNFSENFIFEKNLGHGPWELGYAFAVSRPVRPNSKRACTFCLDKVVLGSEVYGGSGDTSFLSLRSTSHYFAPAIGWNASNRTRFSFSTGFGLTDSSFRRIYRIGFNYEFNIFGEGSAAAD